MKYDIGQLAMLIRAQMNERGNKQWKDSPWMQNYFGVKVKPGKKYTKIDILSGGQCSGRYMIDTEGNIFGIKAYGVIHRGHNYGTLNTVDNYYWGDYIAVKR